jgi:hypothetical protein
MKNLHTRLRSRAKKNFGSGSRKKLPLHRLRLRNTVYSTGVHFSGGLRAFLLLTFSIDKPLRLPDKDLVPLVVLGGDEDHRLLGPE